MGKTVGYVLVVMAIGVLAIGVVFLAAGVIADRVQIAGAVLGFGLLFVFIVAPLAAFGVISIVRGGKDSAKQEEADAQRKILDMIATRGEVGISDIVIELQTSTDAVQQMIYKLVGMGVFAGYVNWDTGMLYSSQASELRDLRECKNCGGSVAFAGKGILQCPHCGTEYFLT